MKKLTSIALALLLIVSCFAFAVSAEDGVSADGYVFTLTGVNGTHAGEDNYITTTQDAYANINGNWIIAILLNKVSDGVYTAAEDAIVAKGTAPAITLADDQIILTVHSSTSDPTQAETYPNVNGKLAAMAVTAGMYFTVEGVDVAAGTMSDGAKVTCSATAPDGGSDKPATKPATGTINLIDEASASWVSTPVNENDVAYEFVNGIHCTSAGGWPWLTGTFTTPITIDPAKTKLNIEFTLVSGGTSIRLGSGSNLIYLNHYVDIPLDDLDNSGDVVIPGTYSATIDFADFGFNAGGADDKYTATTPLVLNDDGTITLDSLTIFAVGGENTVSKCELVIEGDEPTEGSSEAPATESSAPATSTEASKAPTTGDAGLIALTVIALLAAAGVVVAKKAR